MARPDLLMLGPYPDWDMEALEKTFTVHRLWEADDKDEFLNKRREIIRAIATRGELGASAGMMARFSNLEIVSVYGVGTDAVDLVHARQNNILVTNTPDVLTGDVADLAIALLLAAARELPKGERHVRSGAWRSGGMALTTRMHGKKLGIAGMGRIGQAVAKRAAAFDCDISYYSRTPHVELQWPHVADLVRLAENVEFLIVTLAGGKDTKALIDAEVLQALGPDGILVNVSRGTTVDEGALLDALQQRTIKAAGLDVFLNEPDIDPRFLGLDNVVLQPHHGSGTRETRKAMGQLVRDNLSAHFSGRPLLTPVA